MAKAKDEKDAQAARRLCFVIGPIGKEGEEIRKHADLLLHMVVKHVLQEPPLNYQVKRADEDADPGMISDRMITDIVNADLVVADLTNLNPNAFYELGIRHAAEKPAIHIARTGTLLPFDNFAHRAIFVDLTDWTSIEKARHGLTEMAKYIDQPGYKVSNPITQANASFKMRESADPKEMVIAELREDFSRLERELKSLRSDQRRSDQKSSLGADFGMLAINHANMLVARAQSQKFGDDQEILDFLTANADTRYVKQAGIDTDDGTVWIERFDGRRIHFGVARS